jgi:hypothetical protein
MSERPQDNLDLAPEGFAGLQVEAPTSALARFSRRASLIRKTNYVLSRQLYGFWIVLHTLLNLLFKKLQIPVARPSKQAERRYRQAVKNSPGERP